MDAQPPTQPPHIAERHARIQGVMGRQVALSLVSPVIAGVVWLFAKRYFQTIDDVAFLEPIVAHLREIFPAIAGQIDILLFRQNASGALYSFINYTTAFSIFLINLALCVKILSMTNSSYLRDVVSLKPARLWPLLMILGIVSLCTIFLITRADVDRWASPGSIVFASVFKLLSTVFIAMIPLICIIIFIEIWRWFVVKFR